MIVFMISSMTAFARHTCEGEWGSATWELRSVNHRYLELSIRLPEALRHLEPKVRELLRECIKRGKVEVTLKFTPGSVSREGLLLNESLLAQMGEAQTLVEQHLGATSTSLTEVLSWQGVLKTTDDLSEAVAKVVMEGLATAVEGLLATRRREGDGLNVFMLERIGMMRDQVSIVNGRMSEQQNLQRQKIKDRFAELQVALDQDRLEQEMLWLVQKSDVAEELQRLEAHLVEVGQVLQHNGPVGRRLDFLMQELNREANTLASKSMDALLTQAAVELKVCIEQMREQVQNIE